MIISFSAELTAGRLSVLQLLAAGPVGRLSFELPVTGQAGEVQVSHIRGSSGVSGTPSHVLIGCIMYPPTMPVSYFHLI